MQFASLQKSLVGLFLFSALCKNGYFLASLVRFSFVLQHYLLAFTGSYYSHQPELVGKISCVLKGFHRKIEMRIDKAQ